MIERYRVVERGIYTSICHRLWFDRSEPIPVRSYPQVYGRTIDTAGTEANSAYPSDVAKGNAAKRSIHLNNDDLWLRLTPQRQAKLLASIYFLYIDVVE